MRKKRRGHRASPRRLPPATRPSPNKVNNKSQQEPKPKNYSSVPRLNRQALEKRQPLSPPMSPHRQNQAYPQHPQHITYANHNLFPSLTPPWLGASHTLNPLTQSLEQIPRILHHQPSIPPHLLHTPRAIHIRTINPQTLLQRLPALQHAPAQLLPYFLVLHHP